jgi:hypothetical protein
MLLGVKMLQPHHVRAMHAGVEQDKLNNKIANTNREVHKANEVINNLSDALQSEKRKNQQMKPLSDAMEIIRDFENTNPYHVVGIEILETVAQKWSPKHTDEVVNPNSPPDDWQLSIRGKRNHNLFLIAYAEELYNLKAGPRNALSWTNWIMTHRDQVNEDALKSLFELNQKVMMHSSNPTLDLTKCAMQRFNALKKQVRYSNKASTIPELESLTDHNVDADLIDLIGKDGKEFEHKENITECHEWDTLKLLFK